MKQIETKNQCRGLTLVELMIALLLSLLIMGGAISIFMSSKQSFRLEEDLSRVQENFRYISDRLIKDLSLVGFSGCVLPYKDNSSTVSNLVKSSSSAGILGNSSGVRDVIWGTEGGDAATPDSLTLSYANTKIGAAIVGGGGDRTDDINISTDTDLYKALKANFDKADNQRASVTLLVGNCDGADIFVPTSLTDVGGGEAEIAHEMNVAIGGLSNSDNNLSFAYGDHELSLSKIYYVENVTYEICTDAAGDTGLCVTRGGDSTEMLMPDVTDLQVKYGIDSTGSDDGNADKYIDWTDAIENADITGIKVTLSMVLNQVSGNNVEKVYTFIVKLRNMGLDI